MLAVAFDDKLQVARLSCEKHQVCEGGLRIRMQVKLRLFYQDD